MATWKGRGLEVQGVGTVRRRSVGPEPDAREDADAEQARRTSVAPPPSDNDAAQDAVPRKLALPDFRKAQPHVSMEC